MRLLRLSALFAFLGLAPAQTLSGLSFDGEDLVSFMWAFDGQSAGRYDFFLCAGDESTGSYESLERVINDGAVVPGDLLSFKVDRNVGGNEPNAYFLKVIPSNPSEKWSGFTSHFTLTNMKGTFSTKISNAVKSMKPIQIPLPLGLVDGDTQILAGSPETPIYNGNALSSASDTDADTDSNEHNEPATPPLQPPTPTSSGHEHFELKKRLGVAAAAAPVAAAPIAAAPVAAAVDVDPHTIPYGEQTGLTKYAPMPKMAGTTIPPLDKSPTPQYPTFPFVKATTYLPAPTVQYTDTAYLSFTTHSSENTAAPAAAPTLDKRMQRWLERWQD
ncbi:hypothetical protein N7481_003523 [Penicillium waksmanii]|uniref:uncharacterized protein n=1 Tax=Penicillium waksmanii TaxID=69791 RepID=UPI002549A7C7|nr:uncharacterized protein N7481_003523 [Penicillium waksmanii]KAJ5988313.1 hypothetical protein N7481_003523 [Penicillium waksmanii]